MSLANVLNFSPTTPAAPTGKQLVVPQNDAGSPTCNQSFYDLPMVGDTGSGGKEGNAPAPASGDAAAGKFLKADGTWAVPPAVAPTNVALAPSSAKPSPSRTGLGRTPNAAVIMMTSAGQIWFQATPCDGTNFIPGRVRREPNRKCSVLLGDHQ